MCMHCTVLYCLCQQVHTRRHTGERPFICSYNGCPYKAAQWSALDSHIKFRHTMKKPFKCPQCTYSCVYITDLDRHKRTHTGEKPYKCHLCNYAGAVKSNLNAHIRRKHTYPKAKPNQRNKNRAPKPTSKATVVCTQNNV